MNKRRASVKKGLLEKVIVEPNYKKRVFIPWKGTLLGKRVWKGLEDGPEALS